MSDLDRPAKDTQQGCTLVTAGCVLALLGLGLLAVVAIVVEGLW